MKKIIIPIAVVCSMLISCKKNMSSKSQDTSQPSAKPLIVTLSANDIAGVDLTNFPILNLCTEKNCKAISGTIALTITSEGGLRSLGIYNFAYQDISGICYHGNYAISVESMQSDGANNTYKLICKPQNISAGNAFYALAKTTFMTNGEYQILIDSGAIDCN